MLIKYESFKTNFKRSEKRKIAVGHSMFELARLKAIFESAQEQRW